MIRDYLTVTLVSLTLFGTAPQQEGDTAVLQLLAATGDVRRTLVRFLDLHAGHKAGAQQVLSVASFRAGWSEGQGQA